MFLHVQLMIPPAQAHKASWMRGPPAPQPQQHLAFPPLCVGCNETVTWLAKISTLPMKQAQPLYDLTHTEEKERADQAPQPRDKGGGRGETSSLGAWTLSSLTTPPRLDTLFFSRWKSPHAQLWKVSGRQGCWFQLIKPPVYCRDLWVACGCALLELRAK